MDPDVCYSVCQSSSCSNIAFPRLVLGVMPSGELRYSDYILYRDLRIMSYTIT